MTERHIKKLQFFYLYNIKWDMCNFPLFISAYSLLPFFDYPSSSSRAMPINMTYHDSLFHAYLGVLRDVLHSPREDGAVIPGWVRNFYTTIVPADISPCQGSSSLDANTTDCRVKTQSCRIFLTSHQFLYTYYWNTILE